MTSLARTITGVCVCVVCRARDCCFKNQRLFPNTPDMSICAGCRNPFLAQKLGESSQWLREMGRAAQKSGVSVGYGRISGSSDVLSALEVPVT